MAAEAEERARLGATAEEQHLAEEELEQAHWRLAEKTAEKARLEAEVDERHLAAEAP